MNGYLVLSLNNLREMGKAIKKYYAGDVKKGLYKGHKGCMTFCFDVEVVPGHAVGGQEQLHIRIPRS